MSVPHCSHAAAETMPPRPYAGPVASPENPAAHGNTVVREVCNSCGAHRDTNINGRHREAGSWVAEGNRKRRLRR